MASPNDRLILASASSVRARLLQQAGIDFAVQPAEIDEAVIKRRLRGEGRSPRDCAYALAAAKAAQVSTQNRQAIVIGADQILVCADEWFDKPADVTAARRQLLALRGQRHMLETAVCAMRAGEQLWVSTSAPQLVMRDFTDSFVDDYLAQEGDAILGSVGVYRLEGRGVRLFERIDGDYFAILGLPLVALLDFLIEIGQLAR